MTGEKGVVLLSGGIDSSTVLFMALADGCRAHSLTFDYGQKNRAEIESARRISEAAGACAHEVIKIEPWVFGNSLLVGGGGESQDAPGAGGTYVPGRNTIFLAFALCRAESAGAEKVFYGANTVDFGGYPDCGPEYVSAFNRLAGLALAGGRVAVEAPLMNMTKAQIIDRGIELGVDFSMTTSCYFPDADGKRCGICQSCRIREKGFLASGARDGGK